jgi:urease accessory protein
MIADSDSSPHSHDASAEVSELRLLHLADSALPIGALAHSFGLETLVSVGALSVANLQEFLAGYLEEAGFLEAVSCRETFHLAAVAPEDFNLEEWLALNGRLSALKPARESRSGSAALGQNLLQIVSALGNFSIINRVLGSLRARPTGKGAAIHHATAFGLAAGVLGFDESRTVLAYLHQSIASLVSACQRLLPLGQTRAARILWDLKPSIAATAASSAMCRLEDAACFTPLFDWGAMHHPALATRLFIS